MNNQDEVSDRAVARALGQEIRRAREALGWTRADLVDQLPSGIGERTLLSYEHGTRALSVMRYVEICRALGSAAADLLDSALEKARDLRALSLRVDLRAVLRDQRTDFAAVHTWASHRLQDSDDSNADGNVQLAPATVREMAGMLGISHAALARYLIEFTAEDLPTG